MCVCMYVRVCMRVCMCVCTPNNHMHMIQVTQNKIIQRFKI